MRLVFIQTVPSHWASTSIGKGGASEVGYAGPCFFCYLKIDSVSRLLGEFVPFVPHQKAKQNILQSLSLPKHKVLNTDSVFYYISMTEFVQCLYVPGYSA